MKQVIITFLIVFATQGTIHSQETVQWMDFNELEVAMEEEPKLVLIDFWTTWCGWCKKMDQTTFKDKKLLNYIDKYFHPVKFNAEHKGEIVFQNTKFEYVPSGRRGYHQLAAGFMQGQMSYPTLVVLNENYEIFQSFKGYLTADELLPILTFLAEKHYLETDWNTFKQNWGQ